MLSVIRSNMFYRGSSVPYCRSQILVVVSQSLLV